jgi:alpha-amylase
VLIKGCDVSEHRAFEVKLFESPNGAGDNDNDFPIRVVLSSYYWPGNQVQGIPDGLSDCARCTVNCDDCNSVARVAAHSASSTGYDSTYTRVHRDASIIAAMKAWMHIGTKGEKATLVEADSS